MAILYMKREACMFSISEILNLAVQIESNARRLYESTGGREG